MDTKLFIFAAFPSSFHHGGGGVYLLHFRPGVDCASLAFDLLVEKVPLSGREALF